MDPETFTLRKIILEEFYKNRVKFFKYNINRVVNISHGSEIGSILKTEVDFLNYNNLDVKTKDAYKLLKPFVYYLFSDTYKKKLIIREELKLFVDNIDIRFNCYSNNTDAIMINNIMIMNIVRQNPEDNNFLEYYNEVRKTMSTNNYLKYLNVSIQTFFVYENYEDYIEIKGE